MKRLLLVSAFIVLGSGPALAQSTDTTGDTMNNNITSPSISNFDQNLGTNGDIESDVTGTGETATSRNTDFLSRMSAATRREVEQSLSDEGFQPGDIDGEWDDQTTAAIQDFQEDQGLDATGEVNNETLSALGIETTSYTGAGVETEAETMTDMETEMGTDIDNELAEPSINQ